MGHPSARHSAIDWSDPDLETHPEFAAATGNEVILQPGESVFIPSLWFHHIVSLSMNVQCNTRSGLSMIHAEPIEKCGKVQYSHVFVCSCEVVSFAALTIGASAVP